MVEILTGRRGAGFTDRDSSPGVATDMAYLLSAEMARARHSTANPGALCALVLTEPSDSPLNNRDNDNNGGQDKCAGRAAAEILIDDRHAVEVDQWRARQIDITGTGARKNVDEFVERLEGGDQVQQHHRDSGIPQ